MAQEQKLSKEAFIRDNARANKPWAKLDLQILELHRLCTELEATEGSSEAQLKRLEQLQQLLEQRYATTVNGILSTYLQHSEEDFRDAMQECTVEAVKLLQRDWNAGQVTDGINAVLRRLYINRSWQFLRDYYGFQKKKNVAAAKDNNRQHYHLGAKDDLSLDAMTDEKGEQERLMILNRDLNARRMYLHNRCKESQALVRRYFRELLEGERDPQKPLAVVYARHLERILRLYDPDYIDSAAAKYLHARGWKETEDNYIRAIEEVQSPLNGPANRPSWAMEQMGSDNISTLCMRSEELLQEHFDESLHWGKHIRSLMPQPSPFADGTRWGRLVYTGVFTEKQLSRWATDVHNDAVMKVSREMVESATAAPGWLNELINQYLEEGR